MILEIVRTIIARQHLARVAATPATLTPAAAAADLRDNYMPLARQIADRLALLEKTAAQADADAAAAQQLLADSVLWSGDVNALLAAGEGRLVAVDNAHALCPDAARKGRWTLAQVRALFGL